jgi:hypothetical protein
MTRQHRAHRRREIKALLAEFRRETILIGLLSCHAHRERDLLVEQTWKPVAESLGMRVVFLVGDGRHAPATWLDGDYLHCPCKDDYLSLPAKSHAFFQWALTQPDWQTVLKADDDSLIIPERLAALDMQGVDYRGVEWKPGVNYGSGAGYLLSRRAVEIVAERMVETHGSEDMIAGKHLRRAGIPLTKDARVDPWGKCPPTPENDIVITHKLDRERWLACWHQFQPPTA